MPKAYSADQIRAAEAPHLALGESLMARAAAGLAAAVRELVAETREPARILLLVGAGNNGADTLWAGAELAASGMDVALILTTDHPVHDAFDAARNAGALVRESRLAGPLAGEVDVIVDGILGIGTTSSRALRGTARDVVAAVLAAFTATSGAAETRAKVVACDIPSGINPDSGEVPDPTVLKADLTVTFGGLKAGLFRDPAKSYAGEVRLVEVGIESNLAQMSPILETD